MSNDYPFDTFELELDEIACFSNTFEKLKTKFQANFKDDSDFSLKEFAAFRACTGVKIGYWIDLNARSENTSITFTSVGYTYSAGRGGAYCGREYQTWGIMAMQKDVGDIFIRQETLADKVIELIKPIELDFEDDLEFSEKFYVIASDKDKASLAMNASFRKTILEIPLSDIEIEISNKALIIGNHKRVDPESTFHIAEFLDKISVIF